MTVARRLGWTGDDRYVLGAFGVTAFALGVQIALGVEAVGPEPYPPVGKGTLAWASGLTLAASAALHLPWERLAELPAGLANLAPGSGIPRRAVYLAPLHQSRGKAPGEADGDRTNGHRETEAGAAELEARVHSPLASGPVVAPDEEVAFTVEAEPAELARELEVTVEVEGPDGSRTTRRKMRGTELTHREAFDEAGEFAVHVRLDHPRSAPASKTLRGRVATYREEVGRLFETLKEEASASGLAVGPGSTPRELCRELRTLEAVDPSQLADLAVELEVALYGDDEVDRSTYETVHEAVASLGLVDDRSAREVLR